MDKTSSLSARLDMPNPIPYHPLPLRGPHSSLVIMYAKGTRAVEFLGISMAKIRMQKPQKTIPKTSMFRVGKRLIQVLIQCSPEKPVEFSNFSSLTKPKSIDPVAFWGSKKFCFACFADSLTTTAVIHRWIDNLLQDKDLDLGNAQGMHIVLKGVLM